jgi:hypothetical protein
MSTIKKPLGRLILPPPQTGNTTLHSRPIIEWAEPFKILNQKRPYPISEYAGPNPKRVRADGRVPKLENERYERLVRVKVEQEEELAWREERQMQVSGGMDSMDKRMKRLENEVAELTALLKEYITTCRCEGGRS